MLILFVPIIIILFILVSIFFFIRRSLIAGAIFLFVAVIINYYTQTFPFHPSYFYTSYDKKDNLIIALKLYRL